MKVFPNIILHGAVDQAELAAGYQRMDAFLICYDVEKNQSKCTDAHRVMEFLSTGKVVISNNLSAYQSCGGLLAMVKERDHNRALPGLFKEVISRLPEYNSNPLSEKRRAMAYAHSYRRNIEKIDAVLAGLQVEKMPKAKEVHA